MTHVAYSKPGHMCPSPKSPLHPATACPLAACPFLIPNRIRPCRQGARALPSAPHRRPHTRGRGESRISSCPRPAVATALRLITATKNMAYRRHVYRRSWSGHGSACVFTAVPITKLFACGGGEQWRTCATRDYESRSVCVRECCLLVLNLVSSTLPCICQPGPRLWTSLPITH